MLWKLPTGKEGNSMGLAAFLIGFAMGAVTLTGYACIRVGAEAERACE